MTEPPSTVPSIRTRQLNAAGPRPEGLHVLYVVTAYWRTTSNFALQRAADWARHLGRPLVVASVIQVGGKWDTARSHALLFDGIADVEAELSKRGAIHVPVVLHTDSETLCEIGPLVDTAAVVICDDAPLGRQITGELANASVLVEAVDHNGLLPLRASGKLFLRAYDLRRFLQRELPNHIEEVPDEDPLHGIPRAAQGRVGEPVDQHGGAALAIDQTVPSVDIRGGEQAGQRLLGSFIAHRLGNYENRNHPDEDAASGLSPYLRFGHVSTHSVFAALASSEGWNPGNLASTTSGNRYGWWGMTAAAEGFLDQIVTWRELGYQAAAHVPGNASFDSLPSWAQTTLAQHAGDPREYVYSLEQLELAATHDEVWNAAQRQLVDQGIIHNYLRMLWGKKILEWTRTPHEAHDIMFQLNNKYALDGQDPNSVSGIHWVLGRYDRPWGPERSVYGKVRYMSSDAARRKLRMKAYLAAGATLF